MPAFDISMAKHFRADFLCSMAFRAAFVTLLALSGMAAPVGARATCGRFGERFHVCAERYAATAYPGPCASGGARGGSRAAEGFGLANVELQVQVKPETVFQSGSVGKQFTATAVMMLVEEGKVAWTMRSQNILRMLRPVGKT